MGMLQHKQKRRFFKHWTIRIDINSLKNLRSILKLVYLLIELFLVTFNGES